MKGSDKKKLLNGILNGALSVGKGILSIYNPVAGAVVGLAQGAVKGIQKEKAKNLDSPVGGEGKLDKAHLSGAVIAVIILLGGGVSVAFGWLTTEDIKELVKISLKTQ